MCIGTGTNALRLGPATAPKPSPKCRACHIGQRREASRDGPSRLPFRAATAVRPQKAGEVLSRVAFWFAAEGRAVRTSAAGFLAALGSSCGPATSGLCLLFSVFFVFFGFFVCSLAVSCGASWFGPRSGLPRRAVPAGLPQRAFWAAVGSAFRPATSGYSLLARCAGLLFYPSRAFFAHFFAVVVALLHELRLAQRVVNLPFFFLLVSAICRRRSFAARLALVFW